MLDIIALPVDPTFNLEAITTFRVHRNGKYMFCNSGCAPLSFPLP